MTITINDVIRATFEVLDERGGDFKYEPQGNTESPSNGCVYSADGGKTGSCLFGAALIDKLGVDYDPQWEQPLSIQDVLNDLGIPFTDEVGYALENAQSQQDTGNPYREVWRTLSEGLEEIGALA